MQTDTQRGTIDLKKYVEEILSSAVVIILAAIVGLFLGAAMNDGLSGSILLAVIAGFVCVIYTIENSGKK